MKRGIRICLGVACGAIGIGIIVLIIAFSTGRGRFYRNEDCSYSYSERPTEQITSIDADIHFGKIKVSVGDEFSATVSNMVENGFTGEVRNGTWYLKDNYDDSNVFRFCGITIPISIFGWNTEDYYPTVLITVPESFVAEDFKIKLGAGSMEVGSLEAVRVVLDVSAGEMNVRRLSSLEKIDLTVGTGEIDVVSLNAKDVSMDCGAGSIDVSGQITGDSNISCGVGEIDLNLDGNEDDYNYIVDCGLGTVKINNHKYDFNADKSIHNDNAIATFRLDCGVGEIDMRIK